MDKLTVFSDLLENPINYELGSLDGRKVPENVSFDCLYVQESQLLL